MSDSENNCVNSCEHVCLECAGVVLVCVCVCVCVHVCVCGGGGGLLLKAIGTLLAFVMVEVVYRYFGNFLAVQITYRPGFL